MITIVGHPSFIHVLMSIVLLLGAQQSPTQKPAIDQVVFIPLAANAPVFQINHAGVGFHLPQSSDYIYGELLNVSDLPIENAVITATLVVISGSWPSTTTVGFTFPASLSVTLPGDSNPFVHLLPATSQLSSIVGGPFFSITTHFGNSTGVQRIDILQLDIPPNDSRFATVLLKNNYSHPVYKVTFTIWSLPLCNNVLKFPIIDVLQPGENISKQLPFCSYGGPLQGVLGAVAQGKSIP